MAPDWLQQLLHDFGTRLGLQHFALGDRDTAGFTVDNGLAFRFEYRTSRLFLTVVFPMAENLANLTTLLQLTHPDNRLPCPVHAAFKPAVGAIFSTSFDEQALTLPELLERFDCLWKLAATATSKSAQ